MTWIQTYTGRQFWPLSPRAEDVAIEDIAHALAFKCRFTGHTRRFYSVAQHSMLVADMAAEPDRLWGLLHDAGEAYLPDVAAPIKEHFPDLIAAEQRILAAVAEAFGLPAQPGPSVHEADREVLLAEKRDLLGPAPAPWACEADYVPMCRTIRPLAPETAEEWFLDQFRDLKEFYDLCWKEQKP